MENYNKIEFLKAKKRVKKVKEFYIHLIVYICVNSLFVISNLVNPKGGYWFFFPMIGWGIGLFSHAAGVFHFIPFLNKEWENRKIKEYMEKERNVLKNN